jgi:hypothetical protein
MKQSRFTEEQIIAVLLREHEAGAGCGTLPEVRGVGSDAGQLEGQVLGQRVVRPAVRRAKNNPRPQRVALLRLVGTNDPLQIRCASSHSHTIAKSKYAPCSRRFGEKWTTHSIARANPKPRLQGAVNGVREIGRGWESIS